MEKVDTKKPLPALTGRGSPFTKRPFSRLREKSTIRLGVKSDAREQFAILGGVLTCRAHRAVGGWGDEDGGVRRRRVVGVEEHGRLPVGQACF